MRTIIFLVVISFYACRSQKDAYSHEELHRPVELLVDIYGIPHIYAQTQYDLFFAQGFHAAKERLFQFEIWRRQATGTVAEILGERELKRDIGTRLFAFRKDINKEMAHITKMVSKLFRLM